MSNAHHAAAATTSTKTDAKAEDRLPIRPNTQAARKRVAVAPDRTDRTKADATDARDTGPINTRGAAGGD